jgi:hypothetical protein
MITHCDDPGATYSWLCTATGFSSTAKNPVIPIGSPYYHEGTYFLTVRYGPNPLDYQNGFTTVVFVNQLEPATDAQPDQAICSGELPPVSLYCSAFGGPDPAFINYEWQMRTPPSGTWGPTVPPVSGNTGFPFYGVPSYDFPGPLTTTTEYRVKANNTYCTDLSLYPESISNVVTITVTILPDAAGTISGPSMVYQGQTGVIFSIPAIPEATDYLWSLPSGASITAGDNTNSITVSFSGSASSGIITVYGSNDCGNGGVSPDFPLTVNPPVPLNLELLNVTVSSGENNCYNATQTITVAGTGSYFNVLNGGQATLIAGQNILLMPGTMVENGGYLLGKITTTGSYCGSKSPAVPKATLTIEEPALRDAQDQFRFSLFPNPTTGSFTVKPMNTGIAGITLRIFNMLGQILLTEKISGSDEVSLSLAGQPSGIYLVEITTGDWSQRVRLLKR